jgi:hypothetical protein
MREVEIRVRDLAEYENASYGVPMMRNAFNVETGPLCDSVA